MPGLVLEDALLRRELSEARKDTESRGAKMMSLKEVEDENSVENKEAKKLLSSVTKAREYRGA